MSPIFNRAGPSRAIDGNNSAATPLNAQSVAKASNEENLGSALIPNLPTNTTAR